KEQPVRRQRRRRKDMGHNRHDAGHRPPQQCRSARVANPHPRAHRIRLAKQQNRRPHAMDLPNLTASPTRLRMSLVFAEMQFFRRCSAIEQSPVTLLVEYAGIFLWYAAGDRARVLTELVSYDWEWAAGPTTICLCQNSQLA